MKTTSYRVYSVSDTTDMGSFPTVSAAMRAARQIVMRATGAEHLEVQRWDATDYQWVRVGTVATE